MKQSSGYTLAVLTTMIIYCCNGREQLKMILLGYNHFKSEVDSHYQCRMSPPVNDPNEVTVESLRTGWTRNTVEENPHPPDAYYDTSVSHPPYRVDMINNGNNDAFGVFGCNVTKDGKMETIISITRMRSDADIVPSNGLFTQTVSTGDTNVPIRMMRTTEVPLESLRWRNNTFLWGDPHQGVDNFIIDEPVELYHAGIYECHIVGDRHSAKHGLNLLIVRACPSTTWGPPDCEGVCYSCYNGGICDENTGQCVCAPGFQGKNCLTACGGNRYGYDCEQRCTYKGHDPKDNCIGSLFCLVHPFGCRCNTGFGGLDCDAACDENSFGASCLQTCHCASDECNRYTGECVGTDTTCDPGWTGEFCQECVKGYFGSTCDQECHCTSDKCNRESGLCQTGGCLPQWADLFPPHSCQTGLVSGTYVQVNPNIPIPVNCTAVQGPGGDLTDLDVVLSRSSDDFDKTGVTLEETLFIETTVTRLFTVGGVDQDVNLFCLLHDKSEVTVAVLTVNVDLYELPALTNAPIKENITYSSVTINWSAWDADTDFGDPPIVGYIPYYKKQEDDSWMQGGSVSVTASLRFTFIDLDSGVNYSFSVATVREGNGGEGPKSPSLDVKIFCAVPPSPENVVTNIFGERQQLVEISWKLPSEGIRCRSGVIKFTVYYYYSSSPEKITEDVMDPTANSTILYNLTAGVSYTFFVTLSTSGGESEGSNEVDHLVPVLPSLADPPSLTHVTCNSVTMIWGKWTQSKDPGTPPIVHYIPYHRVNASFNWISGDIDIHNETIEEYQYTFHDLKADSIYEFCVVVVREGFGGEGDKNNIAKQSTAYCSDSPEQNASSVPTYVITISVVVIPALLIIVAIMICLKRYKEGQPETYAAEGQKVANYENAGFGCSDDYASIEQDHVKNRGSSYQDEKLKQQYENTDFSGYETPINNIRPIKRLTESEENPYEIAVV